MSRAEIIRQTAENRIDQKNRSQVTWELGEKEKNSETDSKVIPFRKEQVNEHSTDQKLILGEEDEVYDLLVKEINRRNGDEEN